MPDSNIAEESNAMLLMKREGSEMNFSVISSGDNQKYLGYYHPLYQFSKGVNNEITLIKDVGGGCLVTTRDRSYYIDTASKMEDADQQALAIYTPILSDVTMLNKNVGVELYQRKSVVESSAGKLMGLTSDGAIRQFNGYAWEADLTKDKVQSITKGVIKEHNLACSGVFSNDAYYLTYVVNTDTFSDSLYAKYYTLRLGTSEESGKGFSSFNGKPNGEEPFGALEAAIWMAGAKGWPFDVGVNDYAGDADRFISIKDTLYVTRKWAAGANDYSGWSVLLEYTGDKFDRKLNKDVVDDFVSVTGVYANTNYFDIASELEFPEMTAASEGYFLYFLKANYYLRSDRFSYKVETETTKGYEINNLIGTGVGYIATTSLDDVEFSMDARKGESEDIVASNEGFSPTSAVILQRDIQDHRVRLTLRAANAGYQLTGMEAHFKRHDRTELSDTTTTDATFSLNTDLYCLINQYLRNYAIGGGKSSMFDTGVPIEGAFMASSSEPQIVGANASLITGPDGNTTGFSLPVNTTYEYEAPSVSATTATIGFWYKSFDGRVVTAWDSNERNQYEFKKEGSVWAIVNNDVTTTLTTDATESVWNHIAFVHDGTEWHVYKNGVLSDSSGAIALDGYIANASIRIEGDADMADVRMYNKALTASELLFYYNNVVNNEGDYVNGY